VCGRQFHTNYVAVLTDASLSRIFILVCATSPGGHVDVKNIFTTIIIILTEVPRVLPQDNQLMDLPLLVASLKEGPAKIIQPSASMDIRLTQAAAMID